MSNMRHICTHCSQSMGLYKTTVAYFLLNLVVQAITKTLSFTDCAYKWLSITWDVGSANEEEISLKFNNWLLTLKLISSYYLLGYQSKYKSLKNSKHSQIVLWFNKMCYLIWVSDLSCKCKLYYNHDKSVVRWWFFKLFNVRLLIIIKDWYEGVFAVNKSFKTTHKLKRI